MRTIRVLFLLFVAAVLVRTASNDGSTDVGAVKMTVSGDALVAKLLPKIVQQLIPLLSTNAQLRTAIVTAIMPELTAQMATLARQTAGSGTSTPRTGPSNGR